jgi:hypothetical protein
VAQRLITGDRTADAGSDLTGPEDLSVRDEYPFQATPFHTETVSVALSAEATQRKHALGQSAKPFHTETVSVALSANATQRKHAPGQYNLGAAADTSASVAQDVISDDDTGYITPTKNVARCNSSQKSHVSRIQSNEQIFPQWFAEQGNSVPTAEKAAPATGTVLQY